MSEAQITAYGPTIPCRSCGQPIAFGWTAAGKKCPYDVVDGKVTMTSHFATCTDPQRWSRKGKR
jgi:hypothetical protein